MATIFDIAKLAGTSKSTVSRVISGNGYVKAETRQRVLTAIEELHYVPNQIARDLKYQRTQNIGFLMSTYYSNTGDLINSFAGIARKYHYQTSIYLADNEEDEISALNLLVTHQLDGIFLLSAMNDWDKIIPYTKYGPIATWRRIDSKHIYSSYVDHYPLYLQALYYLKEHGARKIGHIFNSISSSNTVARVHALTDFSDENPTIDQSWRRFYSVSTEAGIDAGKRWIADRKRNQAPDAVICFADVVSAEFIRTLRNAGYRVPEDCKVFGFENDIFSRLFDITTFDPRIDLQAANSFYYLYHQIEHKEVQYQKITPKMIIRKTC